VTAPSSARRRKARWGYAFLAPAAVFLLIFLVLPLCYAVAISFTNRSAIGLRPTQYIGTSNYTELLGDSDFRGAILHNLMFTVVIVPLQAALALGLALLVNRRLAGHSFFRTAFFIPLAIPLSVAGLIWKLLLDENEGRHGIVTSVVSAVTFGQLEPHWMVDPHSMQVAVIMISLWSSVGFHMVILLAALQDVPAELLEAAMLDGAGAWRRLIAVTIPSIRFPLYFVITTIAVLSFRVFDQVYVLPSRPGGPLGATTTLMLQIVTSSQRGRMGLAAAASVILLIVVLLVTLVQRRFQPED
jgi:multiple sugar transport system permease protein